MESKRGRSVTISTTIATIDTTNTTIAVTSFTIIRVLVLCISASQWFFCKLRVIIITGEYSPSAPQWRQQRPAPLRHMATAWNISARCFFAQWVCVRERWDWFAGEWVDGRMGVGAARVRREGDTDDGERVTAGECGGRAERQPRLAPGRPTDL